MPDDSPGLRRLPLRMVRWLGSDILDQHPAIQMLHEARAAETARQKNTPLEERPSYKLRQARVFARGRTYANPADDEIAMSPEARAAAAAAGSAALAAQADAFAAAAEALAADNDEPTANPEPPPTPNRER